MAGKVRVVVAGCGGISAAWLKPACARADIEVVGLVDLRPEALEKRAAEYNLTSAVLGTDLKDVLERASPDLLFNCTVPEAHAPTTILALQRGCHVLCEKPLADTMSNARRMLAAAKKSGKTFAVMQNRRFDANIRRLRAFLASGALGQLTTVQSNFFIGAHFGGFRDRMEHVLILDMAIHTFDAARFLTAANPTSVYCHEWNPAGSWYDHDASAVAIFEMTGGIVYTYEGSWCAEGHRTKWECLWRIIGTKGTVLWDGGTGFSAQVVSKTGAFFSDVADLPVPEFDAGACQGSHAGLVNDFVECIKTGRAPETVGTDNIHSLAMVHGAISAAKAGRKLAITPPEN
jgi:predicted dehydrogenase